MARWIKFLGTAGARFVMIRQIRSSAGVWYNLDGVQILLDPGPGTLVRCATSRPRLDPGKLDAIILTHKHIDHSSDVNVMIEAMTDGGFKKRGKVFAPQDALEDDPVIFRYVREFPEDVVPLKVRDEYFLAENLSFTTPVQHQHPVQTLGIRFQLPGLSIAHIVDTAYFPELVAAYQGADVVILHVVRFKGEDDVEKGILHLNVNDARRLIGEIKPRLAILTHFGMTMIRAKPWEIAEQLSNELGVKVLAANDGTTVDLEKW